MRALEPVESGILTRGGDDVAYEVFGSGARTIVFVPADPIVESRAWKAQVPYLARHARVVTIDSRGNGRSGRSTDPSAYDDVQTEQDTIAVLDAVGVDAAVLVGICYSSWHALRIAAKYPERARGVVAVAPGVPFLSPPLPFRTEYDFDTDYGSDEGWSRLNRHSMRRDYKGFLEFFMAELLPEPHSSKQWEDAVAWGLQAGAEILAAEHDSRMSVSDAAGARALLAQVSCPALVITGTEDRCQPMSRSDAVAGALGAERLVLVGAGHLPMAREPVAVNLAMRSFLDRVWPVEAPPRRTVMPWRGGPRVLYLSSPIGLGHARRDMAIVAELRKQRPEVEVDWLAQAPLSDWLRSRRETVHPASAFLASEAAHIDESCGEHDLNAFQAIREMDEIIVANFMVFQDLVERERYDLWVGDEAWELDHFLHEHPELKRTPYAWLTDFVGWLPMNEGRETELTADYNAEMLEHIARSPRLRDSALFVGDPDDIVDDVFGPDLPAIRAWTEDHYRFTGYVTGFDASDIADRAALRAEFGWGDEPVCLVAVGGSGAGSHLLRRAIDAHRVAARDVAGLRTVIVTGPRIDPASLPETPGVELHGWLPDLHRRLAACDAAIVQGGLTTTMELTAAGRPFVYVPLRNHFEQNRHVRHRLDRYGAGRCVEWPDASAERLAHELTAMLASSPSYRPVATDGAERAAAQLASHF